jgi:O-antigen/teichoic acid export membrane protein
MTQIPRTPEAAGSPSVWLRLRRGLVWNLVAAAAGQGSTFIINLLVANLVGRTIFGEFAMIMSTVLTVSGLMQLALGYTATRYVSEYRAASPERAGRVLGLCWGLSLVTGLVGSAALLACSPWLAGTVLSAPQLSGALALAAGIVLFAVMMGFQMGALAGLEAYRALAAGGIAGSAARIVAAAVGTWLWGLPGALAGLITGAALQWAVLAHLVIAQARRRGIPVRWRGALRERGIIFRFSLPATLNGLSYAPAVLAANALLVAQPGGYGQMGLFGAAMAFRAMVLFLPGNARRVVMSIMNHQQGLGDRRGYWGMFWTSMAFSVAVAVVGAGAVALAGPLLLRAFGKDFTAGQPVLLILMACTVPEAVAIAANQVLQSRSRMWTKFFAVSVPRDVLLVLTAWWLVQLHGAVGLAAAHAVSAGVSSCIICALAYAMREERRPGQASRLRLRD